MSFIKDPDAHLDFCWDWTGWLAEEETITTAVVTVPTEISKNTPTVDGGRVTIWLTGGTAGDTYPVVCRVTTSQGRIDDRTILLSVRDR